MTDLKIPHRLLSALTSSALALAALAGPALATELTVWDWKSGDPAAAPYFAKAKEVFEAAHPGDSVTYVMQPNDQYYTLLGTALASEGGPDLFLLNGGAQARARFENAVNLTDRLGDLKADLAGTAEFSDASGLYAVPLTLQGFVVYYNKALYAAAGLDPAAPPKDWAGLTKVCDAFLAKGETPCFALGNKEGFGMEFWFSAIAASLWTPQEQADFAAGKLAWTSPQVLAVLQSWVDANKAGWFPKGANSTAKFMDEYEGFMRGETANTIGLISDVAHWKQFDEMLGAETVGVYLMPAPGGAKAQLPAAGGIGYAVNKRSAHADLAVEFARTLASPEVLQVFFNDAGAVTANTRMDTSSVTSPGARQIFSWLAEPTVPMAHANASAAQLEELHRQSQSLLNGEVTVAEAAAALDKVGK